MLSPKPHTMAATCVSNTGSGTAPVLAKAISMSWRAAWKTLSDALVGHQPEERREIDAVGHGIDDRLSRGTGELDKAELRPKGLLAHEFGVDRDEGMRGQFVA